MSSWFDRLLHRQQPAPPPALEPGDRLELEDARVRHRKLLSRADQAIQEAMQHADQVFAPAAPQPGYRGPERRQRPR